MPRASKGSKEAKRRTVVRGVVAGKRTPTIAKEAGCSERHVERLAAEPGTQFLIAEALRPYTDDLCELVGNAIKVVKSAMVAKKKDTADHIVRLRAVERYGELLEYAQGKPTEDAGSTTPQLTWEEFVVMYRKGTLSGDSDSFDAAPVE